jgi:hypothetical protein
MKKYSVAEKEIAIYQKATQEIGNFMLRTRSKGDTFIADAWIHKKAFRNEEFEPTTKVVIGFNRLQKMSGNKDFNKTALQHLKHIQFHVKPYSGKDHHGRAYITYGFIRAYKDYQDPAYLQAARDWLLTLNKDMNESGKLLPGKEYSVIPAQSQVIRNGALLWVLTADHRYLQWAEKSANYLSRSSEPYLWGQEESRLGLFYRQSGVMLNNSKDSLISSWGTIFHIDAMYHLLRLRYGHIYIDKTHTHSMIGPVAVLRAGDRVELLLAPVQNDNIGIYVNMGKPIKQVMINGKAFPYFTERTARLPEGQVQKNENNKVIVYFGDSDTPRISRTNSVVVNATAVNGALRASVKGVSGTRGWMRIHWPRATSIPPKASINGNMIEDSDIRFDPVEKNLELSYTHTDSAQVITVSE